MEGALQIVVGKNLRRVRRDLGYSQESFGEHIGWHRTFVGAVERGERNLTLRTVERLSQQLKVHPMDLLWDADSMAIAVDPAGVARIVARSRTTAADGPGRSGAPGAPRSPRPRPG